MLSKLVQGLALAGCLAAWAQSGWTPTGPYGGEAEIVRSVPRKAGLVIAATRNGLFFQSVDGGTSWTHRYFPGQLSGILHALEVDPRYPDVWYAGMEAENARLSGVYRTRDGGDTWTQLPGLRGKAVWSLAIWPGRPRHRRCRNLRAYTLAGMPENLGLLFRRQTTPNFVPSCRWPFIRRTPVLSTPEPRTSPGGPATAAPTGSRSTPA